MAHLRMSAATIQRKGYRAERQVRNFAAQRHLHSLPAGELEFTATVELLPGTEVGAVKTPTWAGTGFLS